MLSKSHCTLCRINPGVVVQHVCLGKFGAGECKLTHAMMACDGHERLMLAVDRYRAAMLSHQQQRAS